MAANTTGGAKQLRMKLLIHKKARRVVFAEAGKDVVDFLFSLLALPIGAAVGLIGKDAMVGCAGDLYASVEFLDDTYLQPGAARDAVLRPVVLCQPVATSASSFLRLPPPEPSKTFFRCSYSTSYSNCIKYVTDVSGTRCPSCGNGITVAMEYVAPAAKSSGSSGAVVQNAGEARGGKGLVQGVVTYSVTDNLVVTPMSAITSVALLNAHGVTDLGALQEKTVLIGFKERLGILKASLQSRTVLTNVFLARGGAKA